MRTRQEIRVLFLPDDPSEGIRVLDAAPGRPFHPFALVLWGSKSDTFVRQLTISTERQLTGPLPGYEFESDIGFDEFRELCIPRPDLLMPALTNLREVGLLHHLSLSTVEAMASVELTVEGPIEHAVLIGRVPRIEAEAA